MRTGVRPGWIESPWSRWRTTAWTACCVSCVVTSNRVGIVPRRPGAWRSRNHEAVSGRWGFRRRRHSHRSSSDDLGFVVVTHPFHPLNGQRLEVLFVKRRGADDGVRVRGRCRRSGDDAVVVDGSGRAAAAASVVDRGAGRSVGGDTRHRGLLIVMAGHDTLLCDECTQERSVRSSTRALLDRRRRLAARLGDVEQVLTGSLTEQTRRCGRRIAAARRANHTVPMPTSPRNRPAGAGRGTCRRPWSRWCGPGWPGASRSATCWRRSRRSTPSCWPGESCGSR